MGAAGWGIGCDGTAVKLVPQDWQKAASGGASLPQLGQNMIFIYFSLCIKNFRYQSRDCYICVLGLGFHPSVLILLMFRSMFLTSPFPASSAIYSACELELDVFEFRFLCD